MKIGANRRLLPFLAVGRNSVPPHGEQQRKQTAGGGEQQPRVRHDGHDPRRHPGAQQERELAASESGKKETRHDGLRIAEQHLMAVPA